MLNYEFHSLLYLKIVQSYEPQPGQFETHRSYKVVLIFKKKRVLHLQVQDNRQLHKISARSAFYFWGKMIVLVFLLAVSHSSPL